MFDHGAVSAMLQSRLPRHSLPRALYVDPSVYDIELEEIWYRNWLFALPACELSKPGSYSVFDVGGCSVVIVRGDDRVIRAFHNTCRHRGSVLCQSASGTRPKIVCPYHQWTYGLDGRLLWARDMGPDFDRNRYPLKPVHCREVRGLVYVCLAAEAPPFEEFAGALERYLAPHDLENSKVAHATTTIERGNWKLVWENNRECYHCAGNHPSLSLTFPEDPWLINDGALADEVKAFRARCEAAGAPAGFCMSEEGDWRLVRTPLIGAAESYTMDGRPAVSKPNSSFATSFANGGAGALLKFHYPTTWNHFLADHSILFRLSPISPTETQLTTKWLVHKDAVEGRDYDLKRLTEVWTNTNAEDKRVVEDNQRGVMSRGYEPGPYAPGHEVGVAQFVDWYAATLLARLMPVQQLAAE